MNESNVAPNTSARVKSAPRKSLFSTTVSEKSVDRMSAPDAHASIIFARVSTEPSNWAPISNEFSITASPKFVCGISE